MGQSETDREKQAPVSQNYQPVRAARGTRLTCAGWPQEAALRMLMNSLDEEVAEQSRELVACGTTGKVLQDWNSYHKTVATLKNLKNDETLLVKSRKPAGVFETHEAAPRVLIAGSDPAGQLHDEESSRDVEPRATAMPSQAAATSWTFVGTQGELPTTFHTLDAITQKHFDGSLGGKLIVSGGMGAAGGALSLASGLLGGAFLGIEMDEEKIKRRIRAGLCDYCVNTLDEALRILKNAVRQKHAVAVGLVGNCAGVIPELAGRGAVPDILTDTTSPHDLLQGYVPSGLNLSEARTLRHKNPSEYLRRARDSMARHFSGMLALQKLGSVVFEFGNNIGAAARECGVENASDFPDFATAYLRPLLDEGRLPVRWVALSGERQDIQRFDDLVLELFPNDTLLSRWISLARKYVKFQGLPARVCWLGPEARIALAGRVNRLVAEGALHAPFVIALDQVSGEHDASRYPAPEPLSKSGVGAGQPFLNELLNTVAGASWLSIARNAGYCQATVVLVADGSAKAAKALQDILKNEYALRIARLAGAGLQRPQGTPGRSGSQIFDP